MRVPTENASGANLNGFEPDRMWSEGKVVPSAHAMTCDVEDYFQVSAFEGIIPREDWPSIECRIPQNVDRVLSLFDEAGVLGTFFTLGWVAEHFPEVIRRIVAGGHEIASHGMQHRRVTSQTPEQFKEDVRRAKALLEDVGGMPVRGYRAASWSIDRRTPWVHEILSEEGFDYSSSLYPIAHDHYGVPDAPAVPFHVKGSGLLEVPATTVRLAGRNWPAAGGGYFRLLPLNTSLWLLRQAASKHAVPAVFYFHPWELDPGQPRIEGASRRARFKHYLNLERFEGRLKVLLQSFRWDRMDRIYCGEQVP